MRWSPVVALVAALAACSSSTASVVVVPGSAASTSATTAAVSTAAVTVVSTSTVAPSTIAASTTIGLVTTIAATAPRATTTAVPTSTTHPATTAPVTTKPVTTIAPSTAPATTGRSAATVHVDRPTLLAAMPAASAFAFLGADVTTQEDTDAEASPLTYRQCDGTVDTIDLAGAADAALGYQVGGLAAVSVTYWQVATADAATAAVASLRRSLDFCSTAQIQSVVLDPATLAATPCDEVVGYRADTGTFGGLTCRVGNLLADVSLLGRSQWDTTASAPDGLDLPDAEFTAVRDVVGAQLRRLATAG